MSKKLGKWKNMMKASNNSSRTQTHDLSGDIKNKNEYTLV